MIDWYDHRWREDLADDVTPVIVHVTRVGPSQAVVITRHEVQIHFVAHGFLTLTCCDVC